MLLELRRRASLFQLLWVFLFFSPTHPVSLPVSLFAHLEGSQLCCASQWQVRHSFVPFLPSTTRVRSPRSRVKLFSLGDLFPLLSLFTHFGVAVCGWAGFERNDESSCGFLELFSRQTETVSPISISLLTPLRVEFHRRLVMSPGQKPMSIRHELISIRQFPDQ